MFNHLIQFVRDWFQTGAFIPLHEPRFYETDRQYVMDAIDSTFVSSVGAYVDRFETQLAASMGIEYAIATVNGTAALQVALQLAGAGPDTEVITQPMTFVATANAIVYNGARPVFIDIEEQTLGMSPEALNQFLDQYGQKTAKGIWNRETGNRIAAILPMHTFGHPCRMDEILDVADAWGIPVVEDAAEAIGSRYSEEFCGTKGLLGVLSFNGNKTITCGGGGAIITADETMAKQAKHLTTTAKTAHAWEFNHDAVGYNYRMPNLNAALACAQLERLEEIVTEKRALARAYQGFFSQREWGVFVEEPEKCQSNYWLNAVLLPDLEKRNEFLKITNDNGVMTRPAWTLMTDLPMYRECLSDSCRTARAMVERIVNLPSSTRKHV